MELLPSNAGDVGDDDMFSQWSDFSDNDLEELKEPVFSFDEEAKESPAVNVNPD